jgi:hypothetical protein
VLFSSLKHPGLETALSKIHIHISTPKAPETSIRNHRTVRQRTGQTWRVELTYKG